MHNLVKSERKLLDESVRVDINELSEGDLHRHQAKVIAADLLCSS